MAAGQTERKVSAAYLPFKTFLTALDHLKTISIPNKIDNGTFPSMSPQNKSQTLSAFKFFDLISDDGTPQPFLTDLAYNTDERKALIRQLIETHYPDIVALDFSKITPGQLEAALAGPRYNVGGETKKKAKTFLLQAAQHAGFTVHALLTKITRNRRKGTSKQTANGNRAKEFEGSAAPPPADPPKHPPNKPRGTEKTVQLRSGAGSVTLSIDVDLLELDEGEDREFVFALRDKLRAYEKGSTVSTDDTIKVEGEAVQ
jgi:hypothetical protein